MIVLDCEASSLTGYPIEIGFARVLPDRSIVTDAKMIRHDQWLDEIQLWDWQAELIHKISRANLMEFGRPVAEVAAWLNEALADRIVLIDSPKDEWWVDQLFEAAGMARDFAFADLLDTVRAGYEVDREAFARLIWDLGKRRAHRAAADAEQWADAYVGSLGYGWPVREMWMPGREPQAGVRP